MELLISDLDNENQLYGVGLRSDETDFFRVLVDWCRKICFPIVTTKQRRSK
jgi:hypothetical protein